MDDQPSMRQLLGRMLRLHGFRSLEAATGPDALMMAEQAAVGAFIIDLHLGGGLSGLQLLGCLREQFPDRATPVFILTGDRDLGPSDYALIDRHNAHLFYKGEPLSALTEVLRSVLGRGPGRKLGVTPSDVNGQTPAHDRLIAERPFVRRGTGRACLSRRGHALADDERRTPMTALSSKAHGAAIATYVESLPE